MSLDDAGFAQLGCYGSDIATPHIDALAAAGLRYTNFHVTPLCSPTRASLLTGRNPHAVGMRAVSNFQTGFPNQQAHISNHAATMAEVLGDAGVIEQYHNDVRGVFSGMWRLIEPWLGLGDGSTNTPLETFGPPHEISGTKPNSSSSGSGSIPSIRR